MEDHNNLSTEVREATEVVQDNTHSNILVEAINKELTNRPKMSHNKNPRPETLLRRLLFFIIRCLTLIF